MLELLVLVLCPKPDKNRGGQQDCPCFYKAIKKRSRKYSWISFVLIDCFLLNVNGKCWLVISCAAVLNVLAWLRSGDVAVAAS